LPRFADFKLNFDLLIFDLDGTLIDSAPDLRHAVNQVLAEYGGEPLSLPQIRSMIGDGAAQLVARAFAARAIDPGDPRGPLQRFFSIYEADPTANTVLYDGVGDALRAMHAEDFELAVCTNKPASPANEILRRLGIADFFKQVVGGDTHPFKKPDPRMLTHLLSDFGVAADAALMVGDSEVDAATAHTAGVPFALMTYGYRRGAVADIRCLAALDHFGELVPLVGASG
jgi:phosphoglycolate phosphatase